MDVPDSIRSTLPDSAPVEPLVETAACLEGFPPPEDEWGDVMALTRAARTLRNEYHIEPSRAIGASILARSADAAAFWTANADLVGALPGMRLDPIQVIDSADGATTDLASRSIAAVAGGAELLVPAEGLFDVKTELARARTELADAEKQVQRLAGLLGGEFSRKAPPETVERERERLVEQRERLETLQRRLETLNRLAGGDATE